MKTNVANESWFQDDLRTRTGEEFSVQDVVRHPVFGRTVATYAATIREGGRNDGKAIGVLGIFFDWEKQAQVIVDNVCIAPEEKPFTRCMILDAKHRVLASTGGRGILAETFPLKTAEGVGNYTDELGRVVGYAKTVGYETYPGLGWYGAIIQEIRKTAAS